MINTLKVTNHLDQSLTIESRFPEKSGFLLAQADGLQPPKANINFTQLAGQDGSIYNSGKVNNRNILLTFVFLEDSENSAEEIRLKSYKYFPIKKQVRLEVYTENRSAYIYGYVESNEVQIFSSRVTTQISLMCQDPYFKAIDSNSSKISGISPLFSFPFSNESTSQKLIKISEILLAAVINVDYQGDKSTGVVIYIDALGPATNITLFNDTTLAQMAISTAFLSDFGLDPAALILGDRIIVSTVTGNKFLMFLRAGIYYNILNYLDTMYDWISVGSGDNLIGYTAETNSENLLVTIEYKTLYEGV